MNKFLRAWLITAGGFSALGAATLEEGLALKQAGDHAAAETVFSAVIAHNPSNATAVAERATVRSWQKKYSEALADYAQALALQPNETEWRVGQSRVLYWKGDYQEALRVIDQALVLRPHDPVWLELKGDIARAAGHRDVAQAAYAAADAVLPQGSAAAKLAASAWDPTQWRVDLYAVSNRYSNERDVEPGFSASLGYRSLAVPDSYWSWYAQGGIVRIEQFGSTDVTYAAQAGAQVLQHLQVHAGGTVTPEAVFEPDWRILAGVEIRVVQQATLLFDVTHSEYRDPQQEVVTALPGIRIDPNHWLTIDARAIFTADHLAGTETTAGITEHTTGWQGKVGLNLGRYQPYISYAQGSEPEPPLPPAETKAVWGGLVYEVNRTLALRADVAYEDRLDAYHRLSIGAGLSRRF